MVENVRDATDLEHRGHDVFVSYSRPDREAVVSLTAGLATRGKRAWVDLEDIPPSAEWMTEIRSAIDAADAYLVVVSPDVARSSVCAAELEHARLGGKRIVPVLVRATDPGTVPKSLAALNWIDATGGVTGQVRDRVVQALETDLDHVKAHTRLLVRASEWATRSEPRSLLLRGEDLKEAEALLVAAQGKEPAPTPVQARYVQASRQGVSRRQRITVGAVAIALVISLVLSAVALIQRSQAKQAQARAEEQTAVANSRALAAQALVHMDRDLGLAALLSLEAYRTAPTQEALDVLHIAAQRSYAIERTLAGSGVGTAEFDQKGRIAAAFSPDGELVAASDPAGGVVIWSADSGDVVARSAGSSTPVFALAFSPSGDVLAAGGAAGGVTQLDPRTGVEIAPPINVGDPVSSLAFSPDEEVIAVGTRVGNVVLLDPSDGVTLAGPRRLGRGGFTGEFRTISGLAFSPDDKRLAIGVERGDLFLVSADDLRGRRQLDANAHAVWSPEFSPDGRTLAAGILNKSSAADGSVLIWDVKSLGLLQRLEGHTDQIFDVSFSPDGRILASASADATVRLWDLTTGQQIGDPLLGHPNDVQSLDFNPTGTRLVSAGADGSVILWDVASRLVGGGGLVNVVAFADGGRRLLSTEPFSYGEPIPPDPAFPGGGGDIFRWNTTTWARVGEPIQGEYVAGMAVGPDGTWFAGGTVDGGVLRWPTDGGSTPDQSLASVDDVLFGMVAVSPDGRTIAVGGFDGLHLWDLATGDALPVTLPGYDNVVYGVAFSPNGKVLATGDWDGRVRIWDTTTWKPIHNPLAEGLQQVYAVTFNPTGALFAAAGFDGSVIVWNTSNWKRVRELTISDAAISIAFSPDGRVLAVGTEAGEVQFIDVETGRLIGAPVSGQRDWVNSVAFAPNGETLVAGSQDGSIALIPSTAWTHDVALLAQKLCQVAGGGMTEAEWHEFVDFEPYDPGCPRL